MTQIKEEYCNILGNKIVKSQPVQNLKDLKKYSGQ